MIPGKWILGSALPRRVDRHDIVPEALGAKRVKTRRVIEIVWSDARECTKRSGAENNRRLKDNQPVYTFGGEERRGEACAPLDKKRNDSARFELLKRI